MYINELTQGIFVLHTDIRYELWKEGKEVPAILTDEYLASIGYPEIYRVAVPFNIITEKLVDLPPVKNANGQWEIPTTVETLDPGTICNNARRNLFAITPEITEVLEQSGLSINLAAELEVKRVKFLWEEASGFEAKYLTATVVGLVTRGVIQGKPKCVAVQAWVDALWTEYYSRTASGSENLDFSSMGAPPYTVPELVAELATI